jgi:hypothetical protein
VKRVEVKKGRTIETPWLRIDEAAAYCGLGRTTFTARAVGLPHGGDDVVRLYHVGVLDRWLNNEMPQALFDKGPVAAAPAGRRAHPTTTGSVSSVLVDPINGKIYRPPKRKETHHGRQ